MAVKLALTLVLVAAIAAVAIACTSGGADDITGPGETKGPSVTIRPSETKLTNTLIRPTWIGAEAIKVEGNSISIPLSEVDSGKMLHFGITDGQGGRMNFMAYGLNGETYARANVCPPCRSVGFSLLGDILICDSCGTRFDAITGNGISGACKDYPKAEVAHAISDGKLAMQYNDLVTAYANTGKPGWP